MSETNLQLFPGVFRSTVGGENPGFFLHSDGRVGIGNKAPTAKPLWSSNNADRNKLNVTGHTHIDGNLNVTGYLYGDGSTLSGVAAVIGGYWDLDASNNNISYSAGNVIVSGRLESTGTTGISLGGGTTAQRPTYAPLGTIRYNSDTGYMEAYTVTEWGTLATPPSIVSISPTNVLLADTATQVFTASGASFDPGLDINLVGADGTNYDVVDRTFVNATTTTFKMGDLSSATAQLANRPYKVKITGGSGLASTSTQTINFTGTSWTSPAAGSAINFFTLSSTNFTLVGTDAVGGTNRTFELAPGNNLPVGLSLSGEGVISGTAAVNSGTNVTFRVVDTPSQAFVERTFSIVGISQLYNFTSPFTFTNAGVVGPNGPTITNLRASYSPTWTDYTSNLNVTTQGIQEWRVPQTGTYQIEAFGARGGTSNESNSPQPGGKGARMRGDFSLTKGEIIKILCGQMGFDKSDQCDTGGGGGTFVQTVSDSSAILVAGGGGGAGRSGAQPYANADATTETTGNGGGIVGFGGSGANGGSDGNGGGQLHGASGAGYSGNGALPTWPGSGFTTAKSFTNGGVGGTSTNDTPNVQGGFGGGGAGHGNCCIGSGGGGGYSGGGGAESCRAGGGGGSYNSGSNQSNSAGVNNGHGYVIVTII